MKIEVKKKTKSLKIENYRFIMNRVNGIRSSGRVQVPTGGIVRDPQRCGGIGDFLKQKEFRYRQYSLDERR